MAQLPELLLMDEVSALDVTEAANAIETLQNTNLYTACSRDISWSGYV